MKYQHILWIALLFVACSNKSDNKETKEKESALSQYFNKEWANNKLWYDGLAEVAIYDAQRKVYDKQRDFEYTYITVAEDFNKEYNVKTDDYERKDLFKVMKINAFCKIETENYPYHYLTSIFLDFNKPWLVKKLTNSSQEWCGNTFKEFLLNGDDYKMTYHSYFDGEGDGEKKISSETLLEDQLNYTLRSLNFKDSLAFKTKILESQISNKIGKLKIYDSEISVTDGLQELGNVATWKVSVKLDSGKTNVYYFEKAYPNILVKQNTWDERNLKLKKTSRYAYWKH